MNMKKTANLLFMAVLFFSLAACLEFNEVVQLKRDGSALLTLVIKMPDIVDKDKKSEDAQSKDLKDSAEDLLGGLSQGYQIVDQGQRQVNGLNLFTLSVSLPSLEGVKELYRHTGFKKKEGGKAEVSKGKDSFERIFLRSEHFKVKKTKEGTLLITRSFAAPKDGDKASSPKNDKGKEKDKEMEKMNQELEDAMLNAFYFTFEFVSPTEVKSSNATRVVGNTYRWETTFGFLSRNQFTMELEIADLPK